MPKKPSPSAQRPVISPARELALLALEDVRNGAFAEHALARRPARSSGLGAEDRALATELVYGVLRRLTRLDAIIKRCLDTPSRRLEHRVRQVLRIALYQIIALDRVPDHAAVDQAVRQARDVSGNRAGGFVNGLLRRALRELDAVDPKPRSDAASLAEYYSHPRWLVERWIRRLGPEQTLRVLELNNTVPRTVVRVNTLKTTRDALADLWRRNGISTEAVPGLPLALRLESVPGPVQELPGYAKGLFMGQAPASQMIAPLLGVEAGERILDACAAPGGKTSHLAALTGDRARIVALESDPVRLDEMRSNLERLGVDGVDVVQGDASDRDFVASLGLFDRVLLDAPCTNLGVLRRSPEARYRVRHDDPKVMAALQLRMLEAVGGCLKPGGTLLYSVCTVTEEETVEAARTFLAKVDGFRIDPITEAPGDLVDDEGFFLTFPPGPGLPGDGFFAARFRRDE